MDVIYTESAFMMHGVAGRMLQQVIEGRQKPECFTNQYFKASRPVQGYGAGAVLTVEVRFDDNCRNGHNTFAITAIVRIPGKRDMEAMGCLHDDIGKVFPELAHLIPWHLCSTDGPMHYLANTVYLAGNRDCHGLLKGESRQIVGKNGPAWILQQSDVQPLHILPKYADGDSPPAVTPSLVWAPWCRIGEGKERQLEAARRTAVWPDAPDSILMAEPAELQAALESRLPALLDRFRHDMESAGFAWAPAL